jgi:hypothetical protein
MERQFSLWKLCGRFLRAWPIVGLASLALVGCAGLPPTQAISNYRSYPLPAGNQNSTFIPVADLVLQNSADSNFQFTTLQQGRIQAVAQVRIDNPGGAAVRGACRLRISDGTGPANGLSDMTPRSAVWYTTENAAYSVVVPLVGYAVKTPGTYNITVECAQLAFNGATSAMLDNMVVFQGAP